MKIYTYVTKPNYGSDVHGSLYKYTVRFFGPALGRPWTRGVTNYG